MSFTTGDRTIPTGRILGQPEPAGGPEDGPSSSAQPGRGLGRMSFTQSLRSPSFLSRWRNGGVDEENVNVNSPKPEQPPIPSALQPPPEVYTTPLPTLSMVVLSIVSVSEKRQNCSLN